MTEEAVQAGRRTLSSRDCIAGGNTPQRAQQRVKEVLRDACGKEEEGIVRRESLGEVMVCSITFLIVYLNWMCR